MKIQSPKFLRLGGLAAALTLTASLGWSAQTITGNVILKSQNGEALKDASNVVVFLDGVKGEFAPPAEISKMASQDKAFVPEVLPILKGTTVHFPNNDKIYHNAFSLSKNKPFDLGLYKKGADANKTVTFDKPGLVKVYCNIHEKMIGHIVVLENPYYSLSNKEGKFLIPNVPAGKYKMTAWQRFGNPVTKEITIADSGEFKVDLQLVKTGEVDIELHQENHSQKHLNKWGQPYKSKY